MNFILEQIIYIIILFITNPCNFLYLLKNIKILPFGREVRKVIVENDIIKKYYRNRQVYQKNVNYYHIMKNFDFIPKNISYNDKQFLIVQEFKGRLLRKTDMSIDIIKQFENIIEILKQNNIMILDIKPLFFNNYIINNMTILDNKIYLVDYGDIIIKDKESVNIFYQDYLNIINNFL